MFLTPGAPPSASLTFIHRYPLLSLHDRVCRSRKAVRTRHSDVCDFSGFCVDPADGSDHVRIPVGEPEVTIPVELSVVHTAAAARHTK